MFTLATFNLENLELGGRNGEPDIEQRIAVLRPQLIRLRADILCLQEVNAERESKDGPRKLLALDRLIAGTIYADMHQAPAYAPGRNPAADKHNLVILSRFPVDHTAQVRHELVDAPQHHVVTATDGSQSYEPVGWDRPVLYCQLNIDDDRILHVLNVHLRAPIAAPVSGQKLDAFTWKSVGGWAEGFYLASMKRAGQALEARLMIEKIFDQEPGALIAVCGDFNAVEDEVPLRILRGEEEDTGNGHLAPRSLILTERSIAANQRYSVVHHGRHQMLDHILVSRQLMGWFAGAEIHNEDLGDELVSYRDVLHPPDSLHAPVLARFENPMS